MTRRGTLASPLAMAVTCSLVAGSALAAEPVARRGMPPLRLDAEVEYYLPLQAGRSIHTVFTNAVFGVQLLRNVLVLEAGATATGAWGNITQWDQSLNDVKYDTAVFGAGPIFLIRVEPLHVGRLSLSLELLGGLVVYSDRFPPGGDYYNFTWRMGGSLHIRLTDTVTLTAGARWMHVSNGQGLGRHNPAYESVGFPLGLIYRL